MDRLPLRIASRSLKNQGKRDWYKIIRNQAGPSQVMIYDEIGYFGVTAQNFITDVAAAEDPLEVHLNTPGGEVFDGLAIHNALKPRQPEIVVDSLAASIGSVIAMAAGPGKLVMARHSQMMIHLGFGQCVGDAADMRKAADILDRISGDIAGIYADRTGAGASYWLSLMKDETWFGAQEAVDKGLADRVQGADTVSNTWDLTVFRNASVDNSPWDAARAWAAGSASDSPAVFFRGICAGEKTSGDPSTQAHWALPHHYHPGDPPNAAGVRNAMSRLPQTQGLANAEAAHSHLQAHMHAISPGEHTGMESAWDPEAFRKAFKEAMAT